ncbi:MAG TPA: redox-sensing transcriptional repressor Rex [Candidatus Omnitrophica bacterium]|nr:redox-sensing transcriptional repressor Rex [Candidatus Omnitrophota bacterium]
MHKEKIPKTTIYRLALYLRTLEKVAREKKVFISSQEMGKLCGVDSAQLRKDLSYFGQFGEVGRGYNVSILITNLKKILKLHRRVWKVALAGVGHLGTALLSYRGFREAGFDICCAFDSDPQKIGKKIQRVKIYSHKKMREVILKHRIKIGIIAVPPESAPDVAEKMVSAGVKALLNFAPVRLSFSSSVIVKNVDLSTELLSLPFYLKC